MALPSPFFAQSLVPNLPTENYQQNEEQISRSLLVKRSFISFCKYCQEGFSSDTELFQHRRTHVKCPYDNCCFNANETVIAAHIQKVHLRQNTNVKIQDLTTPEQIQKWREERRKKYPTTQNVILRQQIQEEKIKRGERLQDNNRRFGGHEQRDFIKSMGRNQNKKNNNRQNNQQDNNQNNKQDNNQNNNRNKHRNNDKFNKRQQKFKDRKEISKEEEENTKTEHPISTVETAKIVPETAFKTPRVTQRDKKLPSNDNDDEEIKPLMMFKGTAQMNNYQSTKTADEKKTALSLLGSYGSDSENDDENEEIKQVTEDLIIHTPTLSQNESLNALDNEDPTDPTDFKNEEINVEDESIEKNDDDNEEAPEEIPTEKLNQAEIATKNAVENSRKRKRQNGEGQQHVRKFVRHSGLDYSKLRQRSTNPFLEKLLERDIVHERNVLLQCVNYVVKNNFFGIGRKVTEIRDEKVEKTSVN